jgi:hypothetical protein
MDKSLTKLINFIGSFLPTILLLVGILLVCLFVQLMFGLYGLLAYGVALIVIALLMLYGRS